MRAFIRKCVPPTCSAFSCKSNSFSCERFWTATRFETEAQGNSRINKCKFYEGVGNLLFVVYSRLGDEKFEVPCSATTAKRNE